MQRALILPRESVGVQKVLRTQEDRRPTAAHGGQPSQGIIKYCACHAKLQRAIRLPHENSIGVQKVCACHARRPPPHSDTHGGRPSQGKYCVCHAKQHRSAESAAPATRNSIGVQEVFRTAARGGQPSPGNIKYCACHAKQHRSAESTAPATQEDRRPTAAHGGPRRPTFASLLLPVSVPLYPCLSLSLSLSLSLFLCLSFSLSLSLCLFPSVSLSLSLSLSVSFSVSFSALPPELTTGFRIDFPFMSFSRLS